MSKQPSSAFKFAHMGTELAFTLVIFIIGGRYIDKYAGTHPTFLLVGVFVGIPAAFYRFFLQIKEMQKEVDQGDDRTDFPKG